MRNRAAVLAVGVVCVVAVVFLAVGAAPLPGPIQTPGTAPLPDRGPLPVSVVNFPAEQPVSGTVQVGNLPAVQQVAGTVQVGNLPAVQEVSGSVAVSNLSFAPDGALRVAAQAAGQPFRFVGITSQRFDGAAGWAAMTRACFNEFPGARVAFADEYTLTVNPPDVLDYAWIQVRPIYNGGSLDATGNYFGDSYAWQGVNTCNGWGTNAIGVYGETVAPNGQIVRRGCNLAWPVACAAP